MRFFLVLYHFVLAVIVKKWIFLYQSYFREHNNTEGNDPQHPASHAKHSCVPPSLELQGMLVYGVLPVDPSSPI